jgi:5'-3' exonuclease
MGIPSYFSYIIKNHQRIVRPLHFFMQNGSFQFDYLFMDCNSIIYDAVRAVETKDEPDFESALIREVLIKIEEYILMIKPSNTIFIAFDGVAPFAKMEQQRTRRYKTHFLSTISETMSSTSDSCKPKWKTSAITPGTAFMTKLSSAVEFAFLNSETKYHVKKVVVSCSTEVGEGEHKLFAYLRKHSIEMKYDSVAVYGLDADLLMLSIFHLRYVQNIYVFREAPAFMQNVILQENRAQENRGKPTDPYFLDIDHLSESIGQEMQCTYPDPGRIDDYVFICFFLGNDFLPHFPAMNIRTHGIHALLDVYRKYIGNDPNRFLISPKTGKIVWKSVRIFVNEIAKREYDFLLKEYDVREKAARRTWQETTDKEREEILDNMPLIYRADEQYIAPREPAWESRYYKILFDGMKHTSEHMKIVSNHYLEGLEWVYRYYTDECADWRWKYPYRYPPLFVDLVKYIPHLDTVFIAPNENKPFEPEQQLAYVLPRSMIETLLPNQVAQNILKKHPDGYPTDYRFQWAFCRYFWEAHPVLPELDIFI